jgi:hypothetical protein
MRRRLPSFLVVGALLAGGGCGSATDPPGAPTVLDVEPATVRRIAVVVAGRRAEFLQTAQRVWHPAAGATEQGAALLLGAEERLFPLRAYRRLHVDVADPAFGLAEPTATLTVETGDGETREVSVGAATFNGGGFYARLGGGGDAVYLLARSVLADLRSLAEGRPVLLPGVEDAAIDQALDEHDGSVAGGPPESPWVRQATEAGVSLPESGR